MIKKNIKSIFLSFFIICVKFFPIENRGFIKITLSTRQTPKEKNSYYDLDIFNIFSVCHIKR